jgi:hypothetical protein
MVEPTPENLQRYLRAVSQSTKFFKAIKPVRFEGSKWRL